MKKIIQYILLLSLFFPFSLLAQSTKWKDVGKSIGIKTSYGFIVPHRIGMEHLQAHVPMLEVNLNLHTKGQKSWHPLYRYPTIGVSYLYADLGNSEILGNAHALFPYLQLPIIKTKHFEWNYRFAFGAAYLSEHFNRTENFKNIAIGSSFNIAANLLFDFHFKVNEKVRLSSGIGMTHFSNAALQTPNLGINIPALSLGLYYQIGKTKPIVQPYDTSNSNNYKKWNVMFVGAYSLKGIYPPGTPLYSSYTVLSEASYRISPKRRLGIGMDLIYDESLLPRATEDSSYHGLLNYKVNFKTGINISQSLVISRLQVLMQLGMYTFRTYNEGKNFYNRFGLRYAISKYLIVHLSLRSHAAKADCLEWGVGIQL